MEGRDGTGLKYTKAQILHNYRLNCGIMKQHLHDSYICRSIIHKDVEPERFARIYATDDDPRDVRNVLIYDRQPVQRTLVGTLSNGVYQLKLSTKNL